MEPYLVTLQLSAAAHMRVLIFCPSGGTGEAVFTLPKFRKTTGAWGEILRTCVAGGEIEWADFADSNSSSEFASRQNCLGFDQDSLPLSSLFLNLYIKLGIIWWD